MDKTSATYPSGTVRGLLHTDHVSDATRKALVARLEHRSEPSFFGPGHFATLKAVCARLLPQETVDIAAAIDARLAAGRTDGWRYDALPPDGEVYTQQLESLSGFPEQSPEQQDASLRKIEGSLWFGELLAEACAAYYSHPLVQEQIGYVGMADRPGWTRIGLNELEDREPRRG